MSSRTYGNWGKPRSAGLYGMTFETSAIVLGAIILALFTIMMGGLSAAIPLLIIEFFVVAPLVIKIGDETGYEKAIILFKFLRAKFNGETTYRSGRFSRVPGGTYKLPGLLHRTDLYNVPTAGLGDFAMGHDKPRGFYTVWFNCFPSGAEAIEADSIDTMVDHWAAFLEDASNVTDLVYVTVTHETSPESGIRLATEAERITQHGTVDKAKAIIHEAAAILPQVSARMSSRVAVTFKATTAETRKNVRAEATEIARFLPGLMTRLQEAGVTVSLMNPAEVCGFVHSAYVPDDENEVERALVTGEDHGFTWDNCGPTAAQESSADYLHDGYKSVTFEMTQAPRGLVTEQTLTPLFAIDPDLPRKRVTMAFRPHDSGDSATLADKEFRDNLFKSRSAGGIGSIADDMAAGAAQQTRIEVNSGSRLVRFGLMMTVTHSADDPAELARQESVMEQRARQCGLKVRRCRSWQAAAFASALGAGIVLPEETSFTKFVSG